MAPAPFYDLRAFLRSVGATPFGTLRAPEDRKDSTAVVEMVTTEPAKVVAAPVEAVAFIDGIQNQLLVTYRDHRPVVLTYTAAGAAGAGGRLKALTEEIALVCAAEDRGWVDSVNTLPPPLPVAQVTGEDPPAIERAILDRVAAMRSRCEATLTSNLLATSGPGDLIVLDGSLLGRENDPRLVSVVKTLRTRYLTDETALYGLPAGWRSAIFKIPAQAGTAERYSTYVRLHDARAAGWSFGMIRLEAYDLDLLDALAARALAERQGPNSGDARWDRHLVSVALCEKLLRARRPMQFGLQSA